MAGNSIKDDLEDLKAHVESRGEAAGPEGSASEETAHNAEEMLRKMAERLEAEKNRLLDEWKQESENFDRKFSDDKERLQSEIRTRPLTSIAVAFGAGFILARLFGR